MTIFYTQKIFKTGAIFWKKAQCDGTMYSFQNSYQKGPFSLDAPQLDEAKDQSEVEGQGPSDSRAIIGEDWSSKLEVTWQQPKQAELGIFYVFP